MPSRTRITTPRVYLLLALGVVTLLVALVSAVVTLRSISQDTDLVEHTLELEATVNRLASANERLETARRGFLISPRHDFIAVLKGAQVEFDRYLETLRLETADNRQQQERLDAIARENAKRREVIVADLLTPAMMLAQAQSQGLNSEPGTLHTRSIRRVIEQMRETEAELLVIRNRAQLNSLVLFYVIGGASLLLLIGILLAVIVIVLRNNQDLTRAQLALRDANEGLESAVAARTAELTRANGEIQRFAYIVSHDLRSPLVNVLGFTAELEAARKTLRGFLENLFAEQPALKNQDAWLAVDEDLPEAVGFIRSSTEKMDRLINSILSLSRQGRRTLAPEVLDMTALAQGVADSLHQRAEDSGASVTIEPLPEIVSDRLAIEQILSNLVENALKYLSPGRAGEITVSGRKRGKMVEIAVRDNGRGIAVEDLERVFELFRRAGPQDQAGEGIGLANVRALAYRLGGNVEVESQLGEGSCFRLVVPEKFIAVESA